MREALNKHVAGVANGRLREGGKPEVIAAAAGVDQGCPLGAFLYALVSRDPAESTLAFARLLDANSGLYMYLDDGYLIAKADVIERILTHLRTAFLAIGCESNMEKVTVWA